MKKLITTASLITAALLLLSGCLTIIFDDGSSAQESPQQQNSQTVQAQEPPAEEAPQQLPEAEAETVAQSAPPLCYTGNYGLPMLLETVTGPVDFGFDTVINLCDYNDDGFDDLIASADGRIYILRASALNDGTGALFMPPEELLINGEPLFLPGHRLGPLMADLNNDGLADLVINHPADKLTVYYNSGSRAMPVFTEKHYLPGADGDLTVYSKTYGLFGFTDWDSDGDQDLVTGCHEGRFSLYINSGTAAAPRFEQPFDLRSGGKTISQAYRASPRFYDLDRNGTEELVYGISWGEIRAYSRAEPGTTAAENNELGSRISFKDAEGAELKLKDTNGGNTYPCLTDLNADGIADLITGGEDGRIFFLTGLASGLIEEYRPLTERFVEGMVETSAAVNTVKFDQSIYNLPAEDLIPLFKAHLESNLWMLALAWNLRYPAFSWHSNFENVQSALASVITDELRDFTDGKTAEQLQNSLAGRPELLEHYFSILVHLANNIKSGKNLLTSAEMEAVYSLLSNMSIDNELGPAWNYPKENYGELNILRAQLSLALFSYAEALDKSPEDIASALGYGSAPGSTENRLKSAMLRNHDMLMLDNGSLSALHYRKIEEILALLPAHLEYPRAVMSFLEYADLENSPVSVHKVSCSENVFNVYARPADTRGGSQFPEDYKPVYTSGFFSTFMHELNHGVDSVYIKNNLRLNEQKEQLIAEAGEDHSNYLRSMFDDGFFADKPQEFLASISNMYFTDSLETFYCAMQELNRGNPMPMRQFLFFASVYTEGGKAYFYRITPEAEIIRDEIPVGIRNGLIHTLSIDGTGYNFSDLWEGF